MTRFEYEERVSDISVAVDRLNAVIGLVQAHYFENELGHDPYSIVWWRSCYDDLEGVLGLIGAESSRIKEALDALYQAHIREEEETQG